MRGRRYSWRCSTKGWLEGATWFRHREGNIRDIVVSDADEVYRRAKAAGAEIVIEIKDKDYGGRGFSCRDPEGHLWNIGTYDP
jgi:uncharacterized glyoxalase superfamily protein PhnB